MATGMTVRKRFAFLSIVLVITCLAVSYNLSPSFSSTNARNNPKLTIDVPQALAPKGYQFAGKTTSPTSPTTTVKQKIIFGATIIWQNIKWSDIFHFDGCEYQNCICRNSLDFVGVEEADLVMFAKTEWTKRFPDVPPSTRKNQYWIFMTTESGVFPTHHLPQLFNNKFNGTMMHRRDATIYNPYGKTAKLTTRLPARNFSAGKTLGAFAYVSNCFNGNYKRLAVMEELAKYIPVDIFSPVCKGAHVKRPPCPRKPRGSNPNCETEKHKPYRFFLSFENTLCMDYITEKFWDRLQSPSIFLPIALGGLSVEDYTRAAPPNSFVHAYNFTSVKKLGEHLKYLMENDEAYNRYHEWRYEYYINTNRNLSACDVCKLANERPPLPVIENIVAWRNNDSLCRTYDIK